MDLELPPDFKEFLKLLRAHRVEYLLSCYRERLDTTLDGVPVTIINLKNLRINKEASGRTKDLADLENLPEE